MFFGLQLYGYELKLYPYSGRVKQALGINSHDSSKMTLNEIFSSDRCICEFMWVLTGEPVFPPAEYKRQALAAEANKPKVPTPLSSQSAPRAVAATSIATQAASTLPVANATSTNQVRIASFLSRSALSQQSDELSFWALRHKKTVHSRVLNLQTQGRG